MEKISYINTHNDILEYLDHIKDLIKKNELIGFCSYGILKGGNNIETFLSQYLCDHPERMYIVLDDLKEDLRQPGIYEITTYGDDSEPEA